jgi:hypothetical protein
MATLTVQTVTNSGVEPTYNAVAALGDEFVNDGKTEIHAKNDSVGDIVVTAAAVNACSLGTLHDIAVTVPAGEERRIGPFNRTIYNDANGKVQLTYDDVTSLTIAVMSCPDA